MASIDALLVRLLDADGSVRRAAEAELARLRAGSTDALPLALAGAAIASSNAPGLRDLAAVLLRKAVMREVPAPSDAPGTYRVHWENMSDAARTNVASTLLQAVLNRDGGPLSVARRPLLDCLAQVAVLVLSEHEWPALWSALNVLAAPGSSSASREAGYGLLELLAEHIAEAEGMRAHYAALVNLLVSGMRADGGGGGDHPIKTRAAAARAAAALLVAVDSPSDLNTLASLLGPLLTVIDDARRGGAAAADAASEAMGALVDVADIRAELFKPVLPAAVALLAAMAGGTSGEESELRTLALAALTTLAERVPALLRRVMPRDGFLAAFLPVIVGMLLEHGDAGISDAEWAMADPRTASVDPEDERDGGALMGQGLEALEVVARNIGIVRVAAGLAPFIASLLAPPQPGAPNPAAAGDAWKRQYAVVRALGALADHVPRIQPSDDDDEGEDSVEGGPAAAEARRWAAVTGKPTFTSSLLASVVREVVPLASADPSPHVRAAAFETLAAYAGAHAPYYQLAHAAVVCPAMSAGLRDASSARVRGSAAIAVSAWAHDLEGEPHAPAFAPFLVDWLGGTLALIDSARGSTGGAVSFAADMALSAVSALVTAAGPLVRPYYGSIMPGLRGLLERVPPPPQAGSNSSDSQAHRDARRMAGKALEALSALAMAAGAEAFAVDAPAVMGGVVGLLSTALRSTGQGGARSFVVSGDDPLACYLWDALPRLGTALGAERFAAYAPAVLPPLLAAAAADAEGAGDDGDDVAADGAATRGTDVGSADAAESDDDDDDEDDDDGQFVTIAHTEDGRAVRVRTTAVEEKGSIIGALICVANLLCGPALAPHAATLAATLTATLRVPGGAFDDVRVRAAGGLDDAFSSAASTLAPSDR